MPSVTARSTNASGVGLFPASSVATFTAALICVLSAVSAFAADSPTAPAATGPAVIISDRPAFHSDQPWSLSTDDLFATAPIEATIAETATASIQQVELAPPHRTGIRAVLRDIASDYTHLPSWDNAETSVIGSLGAFLVKPADVNVNQHLYGRGHVHQFFLPGKVLGQGPLQAGIAIATYGVGRWMGDTKVAHIGMDLLRAQALNGGLTYALKYSIRRQRPDVTDKFSFPSGHASSTFAAATVIARHLSLRYAIATYLIASYVAASRLHENRHFLSDVVGGATVGIVSGRTVTRHGRSNWTFIPQAQPGAVGFVVARVGGQQ